MKDFLHVEKLDISETDVGDGGRDAAFFLD